MNHRKKKNPLKTLMPPELEAAKQRGRVCVFAPSPVLCPPLQIEYFLRKLTEAMGGSWVEERFEDYKLLLNTKQQSLSAWELIALVGSGHFSKGVDKQALSMGVNEVYLELILDVLKQVGAHPPRASGAALV